ncbi:endolytic transglycosylase MltG [Agarivorans sp. TSD2052]|uniref:endolytic transglycosylase MltG n=1 Tax=Agarivorans sp. TSD2052 TaxID=2937286 RepID=UPI00200DC3FF|nr:endolytic transglycosylase MltG [Agarivorans sp. TSD2052]UPW20595.1 endolytic transglycosylase MltG [Agarivorans sp. TSD2052]
MFRKFTLAFVILLMIATGGAVWLNSFMQQQWQLLRTSQLQQVSVDVGDNFYRVKDTVFSNTADDNLWLKLWFKLNPELGHIKVGRYQLPEELSLAQLNDILASGKVVQLKVSLIEGETFKQFWQKLNQTDGIVASEMSEQELLNWLESDYTKLEGLLLPETYFFVHDTAAEQIVKRAYLALNQALDKQWQQRAKSLPIDSPYQALILASIIEKETGAKFERPRISSVFVNRLNKGMRLQTDPTVIYGMGERYDGNIRRKDLREATPYNTYVIRALPPTPIAMASEDAIAAALNPEDSDYYYFVAKGGGEHYFSKNLAEHNRAVRKYILKK